MKTNSEEIQKDEINLTIDYAKTVEQIIADGKYDWSNRDVASKNFPISTEMIGQKIEVSAKLFHFNLYISSDEAVSEMDKAGYRPATLMELLTFGILFPELQRQFPVAALGSIWSDARLIRFVPLLKAFDYGRELSLYWHDDGWLAYFRFLGVRK